MTTSKQSSTKEEPMTLAFEAARSLARSIGDCAVFRRFEVAQEALAADKDTRRKLQEFQSRRQTLRMLGMWGGADPEQEQAIDREWQQLSNIPSLQAYMQAQEELKSLLQEVAARISQASGIDYGAACAPAVGCC